MWSELVESVSACICLCVDRVHILFHMYSSQSPFFHLAILSKYLTNSPKRILAEQHKSYVSNEAFSSHSDCSPVNPTVTNVSSNVIFQWCLIFHQSQHHLPRKIKPSKNWGKITFLCIPQCCAQIKYCSVMERAWSLSLTDLAPAIFWLHDFDLV